jgi:hypothetical protein
MTSVQTTEIEIGLRTEREREIIMDEVCFLISLKIRGTVGDDIMYLTEMK